MTRHDDQELNISQVFAMDGSPGQLHSKQTEKAKSCNAIVKEKRNSGEGYSSEKSGRKKTGRKTCTFETNCRRCDRKKYACDELNLSDREKIRFSYYSMDLQRQREWIARHLEILPANKKNKSYSYYLPSSNDSHTRYRVCKSMFTKTLGISHRQLRTVVAKKQTCGIVQTEGRGGRQQKERDRRLRESIKRHIDKFPRTESHYCRAQSTCQYLSSDLNVRIMYQMYAKDCRNVASFSLYKKVLKELNLRFHRPKKDLCGLCQSFHGGTPAQKEELQAQFDSHISEKSKVRERKNDAKQRAINDPSFHVATFDLQQVIYLPKSSRSEIFYKRRLSNYNFTVYDVASKDAVCYLSHEGLVKRGACEIASNLHNYMKGLDEQGVTEVEFYSDGCFGQNKNSIVPGMALAFLSESQSVNKVTFNYFEPGHGQNEGDSVHSTIERSLDRFEEIMMPAQLETIFKIARQNPRPYKVVKVKTEDVMNWKLHSQRRGLLRIRTSANGQHIDWTKFRSVKLLKTHPNAIFFKYSHCQDEYDMIEIGVARRGSTSDANVEPLYDAPPKLSQGKYEDLQALCSGQTPVVNHPDYKRFYSMLPH